MGIFEFFKRLFRTKHDETKANQQKENTARKPEKLIPEKDDDFDIYDDIEIDKQYYEEQIAEVKRQKALFMGSSVTQRVRNYKQPRGGYLKLRDFRATGKKIKTEKQLSLYENIHASLVGLVVEYLARAFVCGDKEEAFRISLMGADIINKGVEARYLLAKIDGLNKTSIVSATQLVGFDVVYRQGPMNYVPFETIIPDDESVNNIIIMVERSMKFFEIYGEPTMVGFDFEGGYTEIISKGDGDFLTSDTLWDFKVLRSELSSKNTLQLLIYWRMGLHSIHQEFKKVEYLGIYNPRDNMVYRYPVKNISSEAIKIIDEDVIGYVEGAFTF